jgi:hypothetical protein
MIVPQEDAHRKGISFLYSNVIIHLNFNAGPFSFWCHQWLFVVL